MTCAPRQCILVVLPKGHIIIIRLIIRINHHYREKCHYYSFCYASIICALRQCILAVLLKGHIIIILMMVDIIHYDLCSGSARV